MARKFICPGYPFLFCFFLCSCASTQIANIEKGGTLQIYDDEARLWKRQEELQEILNNSGFIYQDEQLTRYVNEVLHSLTGDIEKAHTISLRAYIIKDPLFNAFCLPNGTIYVHTSILANTDNEAQLAILLGHEATHFLNRHALKQIRSIINKSVFLSCLQIAFAGASNVAGIGSSAQLAGLFAEYSVIGSVYGYSREMEREADKNAFDLIVKAGYDPLEAKKFMQNLYDATKDEKIKIPYFYYTHPRTKERIKDYESFIKSLSNNGKVILGGLKNEEMYNKMTKNVLIDNVELEIKRNDLKLAKKQIEKYNGLYPDDFKGIYLSGSVDVLEGKKGDAEKLFKKSIELNPEYPESRKALGMLYYKKGEKGLANGEFEKYLQLNPGAKDAEYIRGYLDEKTS